MGVAAGSVELRQNQAMDARAERRAMVALVAIFALILQIFAPAALAGPFSAQAGSTICTDHGAVAAPVGLPLPGKTHQAPCQHCVCPPNLVSPLPTLTAMVWRVGMTQAQAPAWRHAAPPPARAPPRPPGQGPPTANA